MILEGTCLNIRERSDAMSVTDLDISVFMEEGSTCRLPGKELSKAGKELSGTQGSLGEALTSWRWLHGEQLGGQEA